MESQAKLMESQAKLIQKIWRGYIYRRNNIPNSLKNIGNYLNKITITCASDNSDGRINSCFDEDSCIKELKKKYKERIRIPTKRNWYDVLINDYKRGWLPCNIKSTLSNTSDNTGNLAMCVYSYTNHPMDVLKQYNNGKMSIILHNKIKNKQYNISSRDYYFIVINKSTNEVIINSCKGLTKLTPNINNLPFQVCWSKNKKYIYKPIRLVVNNFVSTIQHPSPSWKETFLSDMRKLNI
jgi:hypothetical protein